MSTMTRAARWAALEAVWVTAAQASVAHPLGSVPWQSLGSCGGRTDLPWTAEPEDISPWDAEAMRDLWRSCPVRAACAAYREREDITAGWWAGTNRDPAYVEPARPTWVPVRTRSGHRGEAQQGLLPLSMPSGDAA